ncbi:MAG: hypothetical protein ACK4OI_20060 [Rhizobium oryzihabitans]
MTIAQLEDFILGKRRIILAIFAVVTAFMLWQVLGLKAETSLEKMVPLKHPYIQNLLKHKDDLGLGNDIRIAVAVKQGDIFDVAYLETVKNITDAVKVRAMDFELPDEWMEKPELFLFKDYDTKLAMISDLRKPVTAEVVIQEINRYADSEFRYADKSDEAAIDGMVRDMRRMDEAKRRYLEGKG